MGQDRHEHGLFAGAPTDDRVYRKGRLKCAGQSAVDKQRGRFANMPDATEPSRIAYLELPAILPTIPSEGSGD
jgi:hypothetical protein